MRLEKGIENGLQKKEPRFPFDPILALAKSFHPLVGRSHYPVKPAQDGRQWKWRTGVQNNGRGWGKGGWIVIRISRKDDEGWKSRHFPRVRIEKIVGKLNMFLRIFQGPVRFSYIEYWKNKIWKKFFFKFENFWLTVEFEEIENFLKYVWFLPSKNCTNYTVTVIRFFEFYYHKIAPIWKAGAEGGLFSGSKIKHANTGKNR